MIIAGLTGSIGMGKSTTAAMFIERGVPVHDADAVVHALYEGEAADKIEAEFPGTVTNGRVDRSMLAKHVVGKPEAMKKLESIVHPLVAAKRDEFLAAHRKNEEPLVILDIPLLFETGGDSLVDWIIVVTASAETQRKRVLSRPDMNPEKFEAILARQVPDSEKRKRADFLIDTDQGMEAARQQVQHIIAELHQAGKSV